MGKVRDMARRVAWAIKDRRGTIHLDKITVSKSEAWGLLADEQDARLTNADLKAKGFECVRVEIRDGWGRAKPR